MTPVVTPASVRLAVGVIAVCALAAGCATTTQSGVVGADRQQFLLISSAELDQMAAKSYAQLTAQAARKNALNADPAMTARVRGIGMGWVSIVEPDEVARILDVPLPWSLVAYLCVGYPERADDMPELERAGWQARDTDGAYLIER